MEVFGCGLAGGQEESVPGCALAAGLKLLFGLRGLGRAEPKGTCPSEEGSRVFAAGECGSGRRPL